MKLGTIVYLYETYHLTKDLGAILRAWQVVAQKPPKKAQKAGFWPEKLEFLQEILTQCSSCQDLPLVQISAKLMRFWPTYGPKGPQNGPIHGCSMALKTFENL